MTNLNPTPGWDDVPQLETSTRALGGAGAPMNVQAQALLNRTEKLSADAASNLSAAKSYADTKDGATLASAKSYADAGDAATQAAANTHADNGDAATLNSAKAYTDASVEVFITPSGTADDGPAIQAKISALLATTSGGRLILRGAPFVINSKVSIPKTAKGLIVQGEGIGTVVQNGPSLPAGPMFDIGAGSSAAGGVEYVFRDMQIANATGSTTVDGFNCLNANGIVFDNVQFGAVRNAVSMNSCYATRFVRCKWNGVKLYGVYSSTSAHNIIIDKCSAFGVGGSILKIDAATNNIVFDKCDFESCANIYNLAANSTSIRVNGCYIEYTTNIEFFHNGGQCFAVEINNNWIALNGGGSSGGAGGGTAMYQNISGGSFRNNTVYNMHITWDTSVSDVDAGGNVMLGGGTVAQTPFNSAAGILVNGWTAGAYTPCYKKYVNGTVELRGSIVSGQNGNVAFALPAAYRPAQRLYIPAITEDGIIATVIIDTNGNVVPNISGAPSGKSLHLDGITYDAG